MDSGNVDWLGIKLRSSIHASRYFHFGLANVREGAYTTNLT